jgi:hypothetical protein
MARILREAAAGVTVLLQALYHRRPLISVRRRFG